MATGRCCQLTLMIVAGHESGEENVQIYREAVTEGRVVYRLPQSGTAGAGQSI